MMLPPTIPRDFVGFGVIAIVAVIFLGVVLLNGILHLVSIIKQKAQETDAWKRRMATRSHILRHVGNIYDQQKTNHQLTVLLVSMFVIFYLMLGYAFDVLVLKSDA